jgi:hypothetical protein
VTIWNATENERWAEARDLIRLHGDDLPKVYAAECAKLAETADWDGIGRWVELIHRAEALRHQADLKAPDPAVVWGPEEMRQ